MEPGTYACGDSVSTSPDSVLLSLVTAGTFAALSGVVMSARDETARAERADRILAVANDLDRLVVNLWRSWRVARSVFDRQAAELRRLSADHWFGQAGRADRIARDGASFLLGHPGLIGSIEQGWVSVREAGRGIDRLRDEFREYIVSERRLAAELERRTGDASHRTVVWAVCGITGSAVLILLFVGFLTRNVMRPASRAELTASRARVVAAGDAARRRIERDLHDGMQQRLIALKLELCQAVSEVPPGEGRLKARLSQSVQDMTDAIDDLREISQGIHPGILSKGGIGPALKSLARRSALPVELSVKIDRQVSERTEVTAYYVVSEALTNAAKHAEASAVWVDVDIDGSAIRLSVRDDGVGGADPARGSGLLGLRDRVEAIGGRVTVTSPAGDGTMLFAHIPATGPES
ncbi:MAG: sensor histidine kinase [Pseudonocardiaceae bacterium]